MLSYVLAAILVYVLWTFICLGREVQKARAMKVPYVCIPIDSNNIPWTIVQPLVWAILDALPIKWSSFPDFVRYSRRGWHFQDKSQTHTRLGPIWALVTPVAIYLHVADPTAIHEILSRRKDFIRPYKELQLLEVYGPCISTAGWDDWPRHRKVLASPFNESIMSFVWDESISQTRDMLRYWLGISVAGIPSVQRDTRTLSLNVLAAIAFRKSYSFRGSSEPSNVEAGSYRDALQTVLDGAIPLMLLPYNILASAWFPLPKGLAKLGKAAVAFKGYMLKMLEDELNALSTGQPGSGGVMTSFVRALDVHNREVAASPAVSKEDRKGLSVDEICGNLFVLNFAGHDTTANTLAFSMFLLAAHPAVQDWISEEIIALTASIPLGEKWDYKTLFLQLKRTRAVFLETLRLYPPVMLIPKETGKKTQTLELAGRIITIPPTIGVGVYAMAMHTDPVVWPDPLTWKPSRWITNPAKASPPSHAQLAVEELDIPEDGRYVPWGEGAQSCPGRKFSEVEAAAVMASMFKSHRLDVKRKKGEPDEAARQRAADAANDVNMQMLLRMLDTGRAQLICREVV